MRLEHFQLCSDTPETNWRARPAVLVTIHGALDSDLRPPTERQVAFAFSLAKQQAIEVPRDALIYRSAMSRFLESRVGIDRREDVDENHPEAAQRPAD